MSLYRGTVTINNGNNAVGNKTMSIFVGDKEHHVDLALFTPVNSGDSHANCEVGGGKQHTVRDMEDSWLSNNEVDDSDTDKDYVPNSDVSSSDSDLLNPSTSNKGRKK
ncbi:hypothetical protein AVEN_105649-1 [Araneus ventricosus]|uniref:Uncharacterized protein n=1 Tax=Araneus ventricosus TaxID=182803 RepID=A0A4Y2EZ23_ARAVE|nr:hypothetical protein AVEN_105649-1 [Araneus ventricosus]